jgi:hypothetical protein
MDLSKDAQVNLAMLRLRLQVTLRALLIPMLLAAVSCTDAPPEVEPVGSYSSIRQDSEHCQGEKLDVWRAGNVFMGLFSTCAGLSGEPTTAIATISEFNPPAGAVAFETRLSRSMNYLAGGIEVPSRDHVTFKGNLAGDAISGTITWVYENYPTHAPTTENVRLVQAAPELPRFSTEAQWRERASQLVSPPPPGH